MAMSTRLHRLADHGQSVWIDFLSRELLESGALARAVEQDAVVGVTSNPDHLRSEIPPTGKSFEVDFYTVAKWHDGQIVEENLMYDLVTFLKQIGLSE
jgi:transaldolase